MSAVSSLENDLRAIEAVNQRDVQFALANDAERMMSQWADDIVLLQPGAPVMRGRDTIAAAFGSVERPEIVGYVLDIQEVTVCGDQAVQWGTYRYEMRAHAASEPLQTGGKIMRVLQRQPDGGWKIWRGMTTVD